MTRKEELVIAKDGLIAPVVGPWAREKYDLIFRYADAFATATKRKWDRRVYVDLFAGAGRVVTRDSREELDAAALRVSQVGSGFNQMVLCEKNAEKAGAIESRLAAVAPDLDFRVICGDCNARIDEVLAAIPRGSREYNTLSFCLLDPYAFSNLQFETIERLSQRYLDFLVLVPTGMDGARNMERYSAKSDAPLDSFLGTTDWREAWTRPDRKRRSADIIITELFGGRMARLGFQFPDAAQTHPIRIEEGAMIYRLAFFSRSDLGSRLWREVRKSITPQSNLFE